MSEIDYKAVQIDVVEFGDSDVIVTSGCGGDPDTFVCANV